MLVIRGVRARRAVAGFGASLMVVCGPITDVSMTAQAEPLKGRVKPMELFGVLETIANG